MKSLFIFSCLLMCTLNTQAKRKLAPQLPPKPQAAPYSESQFTRVDPHGSTKNKPTITQVHEKNECLVCHSLQDNKLLTKTNSLESCMNCHNQSPHSGIQEHLKAKINCIDCHSFHRGDSISWTAASGKFKGLPGKTLELGLSEKHNLYPMLKKNCMDCHKW